jgi:hypothetical protein
VREDGDLGATSASATAEDAPGDAFDKPGAVAGTGGFAKEFGIAGSQASDGEPLEGRELVGQIGDHGYSLLNEENVGPSGQ